MAAEARFRAMGSDVHIVVLGGSSETLDQARVEIERLERLWSRFIPSSEISMMNARQGASVRVSPETFDLVVLAVEGWRATAGSFDPTVLGALRAAGYDRSFELVEEGQGSSVRVEVPGCAGISLDETDSTITLPKGVEFDPGGIGKGYAADLVVNTLLSERQVEGACVNIGGDLRAAGAGPDGQSWIVAVEDPFDGFERARITLEDGAIATSTRTRRRWRSNGTLLHHLIDPRTGLSASSGVAAVTVVTADGWWAEVLAKAAFVAGMEGAPSMLKELDVPALLIDDAGESHAYCGMEAWLA